MDEGRTHYVGDGCPGGHADDARAAGIVRTTGDTVSTTDTPAPPYLNFDGMAWPNPAYIAGEEGLAWRLRYGHATDEDLRVAASAVAAYVALVDSSEATRNRNVAAIRARDGRQETP